LRLTAACRTVFVIKQVGDRERYTAASDQMACGSGEELRSAGATAKELHRQHRHDDQREVALKVKVARVCADSFDAGAVGAFAQRSQQRAIKIKRCNFMAQRREHQRDPPGSRADVEDRAPMIGRKSPPAIEVGFV
jgi:hypothetical protein